MNLFVRSGLAASLFVIISACSHGDRPVAAEPAAPAAVSGQAETFTGEVVRRNGEYRFRSLGEPEQIQRLTRSKDPREFASDEIHLRKYYGKTIVVKGISAGDWIAKADIVGQWLRPGEARGSTLTGPEPE